MTQPLNEIFDELGRKALREIVDHFVWRMRCNRLLEHYVTDDDDLMPAFLSWLQMEFGGPSFHGLSLDIARAHLRSAFIEPITPAIFFVMGSHLIVVATAASVPGWVTDAIAMHWMDLLPQVVPSTV